MSRRPDQPSADVTQAELAVLEALWDDGPATVRQLADRLYPGGDATHYGTVQKLLQRLNAKGCVARVADRTPLEFTATVARAELVDLRLQQVVDQLCAGSWTPILTHLTERRRLSGSERRELRAFLDELERRTKDAPPGARKKTGRRRS